MRARGCNSPHRRSSSSPDTGVPKISMDYVFLGSTEVDAEDNPMIVMVDEHTGTGMHDWWSKRV